jgi:hypothetical protein
MPIYCTAPYGAAAAILAAAMAAVMCSVKII